MEKKNTETNSAVCNDGRDNPAGSSAAKRSIAEGKIKHFFRNITVEPAYLIYLIGATIQVVYYLF